MALEQNGDLPLSIAPAAAAAMQTMMSPGYVAGDEIALGDRIEAVGLGLEVAVFDALEQAGDLNLEELVGRGEFYFQGLPLKIHRGSGSPVRAIATID